jgi:hypothetical protein
MPKSTAVRRWVHRDTPTPSKKQNKKKKKKKSSATSNTHLGGSVQQVGIRVREEQLQTLRESIQCKAYRARSNMDG